MEVISDITKLQEKLKRIGTDSIGLIQTKGVLHEGHVQLIKAARKENFIVVVAKLKIVEEMMNEAAEVLYPNVNEEELERASSAGADFFFCPTKDSLYTSLSATRICFKSPLASSLNAVLMPHYYEARLNTTCLLMNILRPKKLYLSDKDLQLVLLTKQLLEDFHYACELKVLPRLRSDEGFILSPDYALMPRDVRMQAAQVYKILQKAQSAVSKGMINGRKLKWHIENELNNLYLCKIGLIEIVEPYRLRKIETIVDEAIILITLKAGPIWISDYIQVKYQST